jgi:hypothetical protein
VGDPLLGAIADEGAPRSGLIAILTAEPREANAEVGAGAGTAAHLELADDSHTLADIADTARGLAVEPGACETIARVGVLEHGVAQDSNERPAGLQVESRNPEVAAHPEGDVEEIGTAGCLGMGGRSW